MRKDKFKVLGAGNNMQSQTPLRPIGLDLGDLNKNSSVFGSNKKRKRNGEQLTGNLGQADGLAAFQNLMLSESLASSAHKKRR